jgi:DNA-binding response OmpR family regulator
MFELAESSLIEARSGAEIAVGRRENACSPISLYYNRELERLKMTQLNDEATGSIASILDEVAHRFRDIQRSSERGIALLQVARALAAREGREIDALREMQELFIQQSQRAPSANISIDSENDETGPEGRIKMDPAAGIAEIGQQRLPLTRSEFKVLELLWEQRPSPVPREALINRLYPEESRVETGALDVFIHQLRKKLSALEAADAQILSVRGQGWKLVV